MTSTNRYRKFSIAERPIGFRNRIVLEYMNIDIQHAQQWVVGNHDEFIAAFLVSAPVIAVRLCRWRHPQHRQNARIDFMHVKALFSQLPAFLTHAGNQRGLLNETQHAPNQGIHIAHRH